jgi:hypothetical protein
MSGRLEDRVWYRGDECALVESVGGDLITPGQFGMSAIPRSGNRPGYDVHYEIDAQGIFCLRKLSVHTLNGEYHPVDGVEPQFIHDNAVYDNLNVRVPFTGKIRIRHYYYDESAADICEPGEIPHRARYLDVTLQGGQVVTVKDRSAEFEIRKRSAAGHFGRVSQAGGVADDLKLELDQG